jgi:hypothetical protein
MRPRDRVGRATRFGGTWRAWPTIFPARRNRFNEVGAPGFRPSCANRGRPLPCARAFDRADIPTLNDYPYTHLAREPKVPITRTGDALRRLQGVRAGGLVRRCGEPRASGCPMDGPNRYVFACRQGVQTNVLHWLRTRLLMGLFPRIDASCGRWLGMTQMHRVYACIVLTISKDMI